MAKRKPGFDDTLSNRRSNRYNSSGEDNDVAYRLPSNNANINRFFGSFEIFEQGIITISETTFHSIGMTLDLGGTEDQDHNAVVSVKYKKSSDSTWKNALNLMRCDYTELFTGSGTAYNHFAGSIMFLTPGTQYEIEITYTDPDSVEPSRRGTFTASTRAVPVMPTGGTTYYAQQGHGGTNVGTSANPFNSLNSANAAVSPGDIVLLRDTGGAFAKGQLTTSGDATSGHIVYKPDTGHSPVIDSIEIDAAYLWFEGLDFDYAGGYDLTTTPKIYDEAPADASGIYCKTFAQSTDPMSDIVISGCTFDAYRYVIYTGGVSVPRWTVCDNTCTGAWNVGDWASGTTGDSIPGIWIGGEGKTGGSGCVVAYNELTRVSKAILTSANCDVFGNDFYDIRGSSPNGDGEAENLRVYGNRGSSCSGWFATFQPQAASPWYYCYNQFADAIGTGGMWKWSSSDRVVSVNNTYYAAQANQGHNFIKWYSRNDLFIYDGSGLVGDRLWGGNPRLWLTTNNTITALDQYNSDWNTDFDYCGVYYEQDGTGSLAEWDNNTTNIADIAELYTETGMAQNGIEVTPSIFATFDTGDANQTVNPTAKLTLASGANDAVDAGQEVDNLADFYGGTAPDLGCHDRANGALHFGVRSSELTSDLADRTWHWIKH